MKVSDQPEFQGKYLKASDIPHDVRLKIAKITRENVDPNDSSEMKMVLYFAKAPKGLVLNAGNAKRMVTAYGDEMDNWIGRDVELYVIDTEFKGKAIKGLRLRVPEASQLGELDTLPTNPPPQKPAPAPTDVSESSPIEDNPPDAVRFPEPSGEEEEWPF